MDRLSPRLAIIKSFIDVPPETEFQRGYFCAIMDEAVEDLDEAGSDIVEQAIKSYEEVKGFTLNWRVQRAKTLA